MNENDDPQNYCPECNELREDCRCDLPEWRDNGDGSSPSSVR